jgi:uncharacterized protein with GYD domain
MPKYLLIASYTAEGARGVLKEGGSSRREQAEKAVASLGGSVESFYFGFGADDAYLVIDVPDHATAAAVSLTVSASGAVRCRTVPLIMPEELDEAARKTVDYRPPGA